MIGERRHQRYFKRILRASSIVQSLSVADIQRYVSGRSSDLCNGEPISPETIVKELATFRFVWNWAVERDHLKGPSPTKGVRLPKSADNPPFMTRGEIEQKIERGGLSEKQIKRLWASLFLTKEETAEVLDHVRQNAARSFIYPMFVFTAHTGARRSEILRSRIDDFNLDKGVVGIREMKKRKNRKITFRHVDLTPLLTQIMRDWFDSHPGGQFTICDDPAEIPDGLEDDELGMSPYKAQNHFDRVLIGSKWSKIRGFHVLRHSFASNLAAAGVDQRVIDEWMGHQTEEMRRRYRHLFPKQRRSAIESVFGNGQ
ncbi:MAG: tyrosine-type recombinase/integrase [Planctomycetes bacterium]|nr:tyrosine-type recombinase/integrase [Planctomycetota bacterium]